MDSAGADSVTKWDSGATVVRTAVSASQIGIRSATTVQGARRQERDLHRSGLHLGPGSRARLMRTYTEAGGKIDRVIWNPIGTRTTARPSPRSRRIPARSSRCCRPDRVRLFEAWYGFGMDKKKKIYAATGCTRTRCPARGPCRRHDRQFAALCSGARYAGEQGVHTEFAKRYNRLPSWFGESAYTAGLWVKTAIDKIAARSRTVTPSSRRCGPSRSRRRRTLKLDAYENPIQNVYISKIEKIKHPILGDVLTNVPVKTYPRSRSSGRIRRRNSSSAVPTSAEPRPALPAPLTMAAPASFSSHSVRIRPMMSSALLQAIMACPLRHCCFLSRAASPVVRPVRVVNMAHGPIICSAATSA